MVQWMPLRPRYHGRRGAEPCRDMPSPMFGLAVNLWCNTVVLTVISGDSCWRQLDDPKNRTQQLRWLIQLVLDFFRHGSVQLPLVYKLAQGDLSGCHMAIDLLHQLFFLVRMMCEQRQFSVAKVLHKLRFHVNTEWQRLGFMTTLTIEFMDPDFFAAHSSEKNNYVLLFQNTFASTLRKFHIPLPSFWNTPRHQSCVFLGLPLTKVKDSDIAEVRWEMCGRWIVSRCS